MSKKPVDVKTDDLIKFWQTWCSDAKPPQKTFGTPKKRE